MDILQPHKHESERLELCDARRKQKTRKGGQDFMVFQLPPRWPEEKALAEDTDLVVTLHATLYMQDRARARKPE
eukprot:3044187-Heterocapsa_arctica.AAC.1